MNDEHNFFFEPTDCGQYEILGYVPKPNYPMEEAIFTIQQINRNYTIQPFWYYLVCLGPFICCIGASLAGIYVSFLPVLLVFCFMMCCI